jgi:ABC-2 type transport system ATP-binding protein
VTAGECHVAVEAIGVSKSYREREALCHVDLIARRGEIHGLLGPNGAGKTTLLRVLLGLVRADAGRVRLLGRDVESPGGGLRDGVAGLIDVPAFYPYMSARMNLALLARLDGARNRACRGAVDAALERTGLAAEADVRVAGYSAGMRQRLGLAAALLRSPHLLLLDEPTSSLDPASARDVRALLRQLASDGAAVVLSSHDMAQVEELCSTLTIIDHGRVIFCGPSDELRRRTPAASHKLRTNDDRAARALASPSVGIRATPAIHGGLDVLAHDLAALDAYVVALGRAGIAIRELERRVRSLESIFVELTAPADQEANEPDRELVS